MRPFNMHCYDLPRLNAAARLGPIVLKLSGGQFETTHGANGAIQNNPSTFQQALYASSS
jgi:hypothetical protein